MAKKNNAVNYPISDFVHIQTELELRDGTVVMTREKIIQALLKHRARYKLAAFCIHDSDIYTEEDIIDRKDIWEDIATDYAQVAFFAMEDFKESREELKKRITGEVRTRKPAYLEIIKKARAVASRLIPEVKVGEKKATHVHIIILLNSRQRLNVIANWFGIEPRFVHRKDKKNAEAQWLYLIHAGKNDQNKHQYVPDEVWASFDYKKELPAMIAKMAAHEAYHVSADDMADIAEEVRAGTKTLSELERTLPIALWNKYKKLFQEAAAVRGRTLSARVPRSCFYIDAIKDIENETLQGGAGRMGKSIATRALAMVLAQEYGAESTETYEELRKKGLIYEAGKKGALLQNYSSEPIVVMNETSPETLLASLGGADGVKEAFEPFPELHDDKVLYGTVTLNAKYIIINGILPFNSFIETLAGSYTSREGIYHESELGSIEQYKGRFWGRITVVDTEHIDVLINQYMLGVSSIIDSWLEVRNIPVSFKKMKQRLEGAAFVEVSKNVFVPITERLEEYNREKTCQKISAVEDMPEEFLSYGRIVEGGSDLSEEIKRKREEAVEAELRRASLNDLRLYIHFQEEAYDKVQEVLPMLQLIAPNNPNEQLSAFEMFYPQYKTGIDIEAFLNDEDLKVHSKRCREAKQYSQTQQLLLHFLQTVWDQRNHSAEEAVRQFSELSNKLARYISIEDVEDYFGIEEEEHL